MMLLGVRLKIHRRLSSLPKAPGNPSRGQIPDNMTLLQIPDHNLKKRIQIIMAILKAETIFTKITLASEHKTPRISGKKLEVIKIKISIPLEAIFTKPKVKHLHN